jgi:negative regulator of replication initiation
MASNEPVMSNHKPLTTYLPGQTKFIGVAASAILAALLVIGVVAEAQTPKPDAKAKTDTVTSAKAEPLSGVELWAMNCSRCHMARNPGEFTAAQWRTIFRHMRVRANLPAAQARELQKYLESGAGK